MCLVAEYHFVTWRSDRFILDCNFNCNSHCKCLLKTNLNNFDINPKSCICLPPSNVLLKIMLIITPALNRLLFHNKINGNHLCFYQTIKWMKIRVWKDNNIMKLSYDEITILYVITPVTNIFLFYNKMNDNHLSFFLNCWK